MSLFRIGGGKMEEIKTTKDSYKNNLKPGRVLKLEGYSGDQYMVAKNLGSNKYSGDSVTYLTISLRDFHQSRHEAYTLKHISQKAGGIQVYITDEILSADDTLDIWEKSEAKRKRMAYHQENLKIVREKAELKGKALFEKYIPAEAKALIIAELHKDESDVMTDYFSHSTTKIIILGWSKHTRDLFPEMRKHAEKLPETAHLGRGKGLFTPVVVIDSDNFCSGGAYYYKGSRSHWHSDHKKNGIDWPEFFTMKEAEEFIKSKSEPEAILFEDQKINFKWEIKETEIEHREKYSMGAGYYLKSGFRDDSGWSVSKIGKYHDWRNTDLCVSMANYCIFEK